MTDDASAIALIVSQLDRIHTDLRDLKLAREEDKKDASESRRSMHETQNRHSQALSDLSVEVKTIKSTIAAEQPTWEEYRQLKMQAAGAGKLGAFLWSTGRYIIVLAAALVGWIIAMRSDIAALWHWFVNRG